MTALGDLRGGRDHDLLSRPDDEPDVEPHEAAEHPAEEDLPRVGGREELADAAIPAERLVAEHLVDDDEPARDEGEHRAPAEPPKPPTDETPGAHAGPHRAVGCRYKRSLN